MKNIFSRLPVLFFLAIALLALAAPKRLLAQFIDKNSNAPSNNVQVVETTDSFDTVVGIISFLFAFTFLISIITFIYSGVRYVIAGGSEKILEKAARTWVSSLVGLALSVVGYIILSIVKYYLR